VRLTEKLGPLAVESLMQFLIFTAVLLTPLYSFSEIILSLGGFDVSRLTASTPLFVKLLKDFLLILVILLGFANIILRGRIALAPSLGVFFLVSILSLLYSLTSQNTETILSGVRWLYPTLLLVVLYSAIDSLFLSRLAALLVALLVVGFALQLVQLFTVTAFGSNLLGLSRRCAGYYANPSTMALFALYVFHFVKSYHFRRYRLLVMYLIVPISIFLTGSGSGILGYVAICGYLCVVGVPPKRKLLVLTLAFAATLMIVLMLPVLTGRSDFFDSPMGRLDVVRNSSYGLFVSSDFGTGTNSAILYSNLDNINGFELSKSTIVLDSTFASIVQNVGLVGLFAFLFYIFSRRNFSKNSTLPIIILVAFSTGILFESFPMNVLTFVAISHANSQRLSAKRMGVPPFA